MKKNVFCVLLMVFASGCFMSCKNNTTKSSVDNEIDSIVAKLSLIDSLRNSGTYYHLESWSIGKIVDNGYKEYETLAERHSVNIYVNKLSFQTDTLYYLELNYWESSSYAEKRESKIVDLEELKSFYSAIDDIKRHYGSETNHYELYLYKTKTDVSLSLRQLINSDCWELKLCSITISIDDLDELKKLLKQTEDKIAELRKSTKK